MGRSQRNREKSRLGIAAKRKDTPAKKTPRGAERGGVESPSSSSSCCQRGRRLAAAASELSPPSSFHSPASAAACPGCRIKSAPSFQMESSHSPLLPLGWSGASNGKGSLLPRESVIVTRCVACAAAKGREDVNQSTDDANLRQAGRCSSRRLRKQQSSLLKLFNDDAKKN